MKILADYNNHIFEANCNIASKLILKWKDVIYFNLKTLMMMLNFDEKKENFYLWRLIALYTLEHSFS